MRCHKNINHIVKKSYFSIFSIKIIEKIPDLRGIFLYTKKMNDFECKMKENGDNLKNTIIKW